VVLGITELREILSELLDRVRLVQEGFSSGIFVPGNEIPVFLKSGKPFEQLSDNQLFEYLFSVALVTDVGSCLFMVHYSSLRDAL
jgi:hypothetical protein